jgi:integrase
MGRSIMHDSGYESAFASRILSYIAEMRSVGYKFDNAAEMLFRFDRFCLEGQHTGPELGREVVEAWCEKRPHESARTQSNRIYPVRGLALHIIKAGGSAYVAPFTDWRTKRYAYQPHIFTEDEMRRLLAASDAFEPCPVSPRRHVVMPMALRLIYGCALRVSEAARLEIRDVDLDDGALMIRATKFNKSRVVPMADGLGRRCRQYADDLLGGKPKDYSFLPSHKGRFYDIGTIYGFFRQALHKAQIPHTGKGPRIHDLRHNGFSGVMGRGHPFRLQDSPSSR